jgi:hypothetical protein
MMGHREVPELKIREHPPSMLRNVDGGPPGGVGAEDPGAPTINAKNHRRWAPGGVPPSTLRNINSGPPGGIRAEDPGASTINAEKR